MKIERLEGAHLHTTKEWDIEEPTNITSTRMGRRDAQTDETKVNYTKTWRTVKNYYVATVSTRDMQCALSTNQKKDMIQTKRKNEKKNRKIK